MSFKINKEIKKLNKHLIKQSEKVERQVDSAIQALDELDIGLASKVIKKDKKINKKEIELEEECLKVLALHQPVAPDLRIIVAILKRISKAKSLSLTVSRQLTVGALKPSSFAVNSLSIL